MSDKMLNTMIKVLISIFVILITVYLCMITKDIGKEIFSDQPKDGVTHAVEREIKITEGESLMEIAEDLRDLGIIDHPRYFVIFMHFLDDYDKVKPGTYKVSSHDRPSEILTKITRSEEEE